jgi:hypothetical protein
MRQLANHSAIGRIDHILLFPPTTGDEFAIDVKAKLLIGGIAQCGLFGFVGGIH